MSNVSEDIAQEIKILKKINPKKEDGIPKHKTDFIGRLLVVIGVKIPQTLSPKHQEIIRGMVIDKEI